MFHQSLASAILTAFSVVGALAFQSSAIPPAANSSYVLGADDQVTIRIVEAEEIPDKPFRIDEKGNLDLPMIGTVHAAGLTVHDFQGLLIAKFTVYIRQPQVSVFVQEMRSQPVSILGAVNAPGVHQLQGHKTLMEALSLAGGPRADAGYKVIVTRKADWGSIPLPSASTDKSGRYSIAEIGLKGLLDARDPTENIAIMPDDVLTIPVAEMVYVIGDVKKAGGFVLGERRTVSVLQALAMAEGLAAHAKPSESRILRTVPGSAERTEIPVDLKKVLAGHSADLELQSTDVLFIPTSGAKQFGDRALQALLASSAAVYRP